MWSAAVHLPGPAANFAFRLGLKTAGLDIEDVKEARHPDRRRRGMLGHEIGNY